MLGLTGVQTAAGPSVGSVNQQTAEQTQSYRADADELTRRKADAEFQPTRHLGMRRELLLEESTANEQTIALWRLAVCLAAAVQVAVRSHESSQTGDWSAMACAFAAVLYSAGLFVLISRRGYAAWLSFLSVGMDVTLISGALLMLVLKGRPLVAVNSDLSLPMYLLAISLAGLRYNPAVTIFATILAVGEYCGVVGFALHVGNLADNGDPAIMQQIQVCGQFEMVGQLTRMLLLCAGGLVATFGVRRARELRTASIMDALTQVFNRGFLEERFLNEYTRAERYGRPLSVMVLDVDHFKLYNDRRGHASGDQVLREIADILRYSLRSTDTVARYGGEEFVCLLPETPKETGMRLAERLRQQVMAHSFLYGHEQPAGALTISIGVACYPDDAADLQELFRHADEALYKAKNGGRNLVLG